MGVKHDYLETRAAAAMTLRDFDTQARRLGVRAVAGRFKQERRMIEKILLSVGGQPWSYSPDGDNSWVP